MGIIRPMYKIFLCLRYLRSKILALCAVFGVALCAFMMLTMVSVMSGFQAKIQRAAKGLFGDIVIESNGEHGIGWYDEFIEQVKKDVPEVAHVDPFILSYGMLRIEDDPNFRQHVQVAGIRLPKEANKPSRVDATDFEHGLFVQKDQARPSFDPPLGDIKKTLNAQKAMLSKVFERDFADELAKLDDDLRKQSIKQVGLARYAFSRNDIKLTPKKLRLLNSLINAETFLYEARSNIALAAKYEKARESLQKQLDAAIKADASETEIEGIEEKLDLILNNTKMEDPRYRVILGVGIQGLSKRTSKGDTLRFMLPGHRIVLYVAPLGKAMSMTNISPNIHKFTIIDDNKADVSSIDSKIVYVPFETLQTMNNMGPEYDAENGKLVTPARTSQLHVKVHGANGEEQLRAVAEKIQDVWDKFSASFNNKPFSLRPAMRGVSVQTWRQRQQRVIAPIESQRVLVIIITIIMSFVAIALIFVILYTIVVQKTKEVGLLKAVGASNFGVARLFLLYGASISLAGSVIGIVGAKYFVQNINAVQNWTSEQFGFQVWRKESFMFEFIPNQVDWTAAIWILVGAIFAGLLGALVPALRAARMQPVEALRYE